MADQNEQESSRQSSVLRWDPFRELREWRPLREWGFLPSRLERLSAEFEEPWGPARGVWGPAVDIAETDDHYTVSVEPPNADPERVDAKFEDGVLTLRIAKSEAAKPKTIAIK